MWQIRRGLIVGRGALDGAPFVSPYATFNGVNSGATISNAGLTATHATGSVGGARSATAKNSGLYYFEMTLTLAEANSGVGLITAAGTYTNIVIDGVSCAVVYQSGAIWSNNANSGRSLGALANGNIIGIAVDLDNNKVWFRKSPSGNWNGSGTDNPATNTGGVSISTFSATTLSPAVAWANSSGGIVTANFGGSSFSGTLPSGFTSGWPL